MATSYSASANELSPAEVAAAKRAATSLPPLTDEQVDRIAALLLSVRPSGLEASACAS